jgi:hypothetical protein
VSFLQNLTSQYVGLFLCAITAAIGTTIALIWSKYPVRWILAIATVGLVILVFVMIPDPTNVIDGQLPETFRNFFRLWIVVLGLVVLYAAANFVATLVRYYKLSHAAPSEAVGAFPDLDAAWKEILIQLSQARIDPSRQQLFLLLAPTESLAASVADAARLQLFARAPASPEAPIHCYAVADALLLSCAGASALGRQDQEGTARLEYLCRLIAAQNPELPTVRGVAVLLPFEWAIDPDSLRQVAAVRDDLQTIRSAFKVRCPTLAVFCIRESLPGFHEFAARMPGNLRQSRCGFSVPSSQNLSRTVIRHGLVWIIQWFQSWSLNLMVQDPHNKDGNNRLLNMNAVFRRNKGYLVSLLETALTMHQQTEPVLLRGCYFVACGPDTGKHAFAAGLLRGPKSKLLADHTQATWSQDADRLDRVYRRAAWGLALGAAAIAIPIWIFGVIHWLKKSTIPWIEGMGWAGLALLAILWIVVLLGTGLRRHAPARKAS